uniref:Myelin associated glycoprotein n=1 Tax=Macaca fascicularis TaxID=9541 RepID=A0A7N9D8K0_MACFA
MWAKIGPVGAVVAFAILIAIVCYITQTRRKKNVTESPSFSAGDSPAVLFSSDFRISGAPEKYEVRTGALQRQAGLGTWMPGSPRAWEGPVRPRGRGVGWPLRGGEEGHSRAGLDLEAGEEVPRLKLCRGRWDVGPKEPLPPPACICDCISFSNSPKRSLPWILTERPRRARGAWDLRGGCWAFGENPQSWT